MKPDYVGKHYAYYSPEHAAIGGTATYLNDKNEKIETTCVSPTKKWVKEKYKWKDKVFVGIVYYYVEHDKVTVF